MKTANFDALVIKSINFSDSDKIFTLFVKDLGKISAKAKGIRKINSKRMSTLDTLNLVRVGLYGNSDIRTITETSLIFSFSNIKADLSKLKSAYYFLELINRLILESSDNNHIYDLLLKCIKRLDEKSFLDTRVENYFELNFLNYLGYYLTLDKCLRCGINDIYERKYSFNYEEGGLVCNECGYSEKMLTSSDINTFFYLQSISSDSSKLEFHNIDAILKYYINTLLSDTPKTLKYLKSV